MPNKSNFKFYQNKTQANKMVHCWCKVNSTKLKKSLINNVQKISGVFLQFPTNVLNTLVCAMVVLTL